MQESQAWKKSTKDARNAGVSQWRLHPVKNLSVLSLKNFFFVWVSLREVQRGISSCIGLALIIINPEVVLGEFLSSTNLMETQAFCVHKPLKVIIVDEYKHFVFAAF